MPIHITEFTPHSSGKSITGGWRSGVWTEEVQAEYAGQFLRLSFGYPSIVSFNFWAFTDKNSWLEGAGLFDEEMHPKPIYYTLKRLITEEWTTKNLISTTNKKGNTQLRGFFGNYKIKVTVGEEHFIHNKTIEKSSNNQWIIQLN